VVSFGLWNVEQIPTSNTLNQLGGILQREWYKIPLEDVQNL
jgi:hypothetical protein